MKASKRKSNAFRYNVYTQQIQLGTGKDAKICEGARSIERYYLELARQNKRVSKDVAFDVVVQVARQNEYNPVTDYLDHVSKNVAPAYIDRLATTYLMTRRRTSFRTYFIRWDVKENSNSGCRQSIWWRM